PGASPSTASGLHPKMTHSLRELRPLRSARDLSLAKTPAIMNRTLPDPSKDFCSGPTHGPKQKP
ncbi:hypothetical protein IBB99_RS22320, partial [Escherichia coli]